jgi:hypothetical protein
MASGANVTTTRLCRICNNLQRNNPKSSTKPWRTETSVELLESFANSGCRFCPLLLSGLDTCMITWDCEERLSCRVFESESLFGSRRAPLGLLIELDLRSKNGQREIILIDFFSLVGKYILYGRSARLLIISADTCPWSSIGIAPDICGDTSFDAALALVTDWMKQCEQTHTRCISHLGRGTPLPKRVVNVGDPTNSQVKLYETQNEVAKYICLTHCRGEERIITATTTTLPLYKKGIPWNELSTTFKDAIIFTRKLEIQYMWIDSLRIIQDSDDDWRTESSKMATIYENSYITLAATKFASGAGGCFSRASPDFMARELTCYDDAGTPHSIYVRRNLHPYWWWHVNYGSYYPLLLRGWAFQEPILSPRVLHFGEQELFWECMEMQLANAPT